MASITALPSNPSINPTPLDTHTFGHGATEFEIDEDRHRNRVNLLGAIVVNRGSLDDRVDLIAVDSGIVYLLEENRGDTATENRAFSLCIECTAVAVGREDIPFIVKVTGLVRRSDGCRAYQGHPALAASKAPARQMKRH